MQTEIRFKIGDIVLLKSGGPKMTISQIEDKDDRKIIQTTWFAGSKNGHGDFPPEALTFR
jgi:uncharacterized protein YodC (DUF2158 family)